MSYGTTGQSAEQAETPQTYAQVAREASHPASPSRGNGGESSDEVLHKSSFRQSAKAFYEKNIGLLFVFIAQIFASIMAMTTRMLSTGFEVKFHALQIIFVRMFATGLIGGVWMWYKNVPDFPWGARGVRGLLVIRGAAGSIGLFGLYYSLSYLDVSDATVITFLIPTLTGFVCWVILNEPFTLNEASAGLMALVGVVFIARPGFVFSDFDGNHPGAQALGQGITQLDIAVAGGILPPVKATPLQRAIAVGCALLNAVSAATAYATIRVIGKRAHSLVSVNYFAMLATVGSFLIIMIHPDLHFEIPQTAVQWILLVVIGLSGFMLQILLTEGLQREKAGRATNLIYTQLIFSLIIDYVVWGSTPALSSVFGGLLILCAAIWVTTQKKTSTEKKDAVPDEESSLLRSEGADNRP